MWFLLILDFPGSHRFDLPAFDFSEVLLDEVRLQLHGLHVVSTDVALRVLGEKLTRGRCHYNVSQTHVHVSVDAHEGAIVGLTVLGLHEDLGRDTTRLKDL